MGSFRLSQMEYILLLSVQRTLVIEMASKDTSVSHFVNSLSFVTPSLVRRTGIGMSMSYGT